MLSHTSASVAELLCSGLTGSFFSEGAGGDVGGPVGCVRDTHGQGGCTAAAGDRGWWRSLGHPVRHPPTLVMMLLLRNAEQLASLRAQTHTATGSLRPLVYDMLCSASLRPLVYDMLCSARSTDHGKMCSSLNAACWSCLHPVHDTGS
jgi:hypothetical protein